MIHVDVKPEMVKTISDINVFLDKCCRGDECDVSYKEVLECDYAASPFVCLDELYVFIFAKWGKEPFVTTLESFKETIQGIPLDTLKIIGVYPDRINKYVDKCFDLGIGVTDEEIEEEFQRRIKLQEEEKD